MGLFSVWFLCSIVQQFGLLINSELPLYIYLWLCISILYEAKKYIICYCIYYCHEKFRDTVTAFFKQTLGLFYRKLLTHRI